MGFNEKVHAFIQREILCPSDRAIRRAGPLAFIHGTRSITPSREAARMAQRAIRDGNPLTYEVYKQYGEWVNSPEVAAEKATPPEVCLSLLISVSKDHPLPWHSQFKEWAW